MKWLVVLLVAVLVPGVAAQGPPEEHPQGPPDEPPRGNPNEPEDPPESSNSTNQSSLERIASTLESGCEKGWFYIVIDPATPPYVFPVVQPECL